MPTRGSIMNASKEGKADRQALLDLVGVYNYDSVIAALAAEAAENAASLRKEAAEHPDMDLRGAAEFWQEQAGILARCAKDLRI